MKILLDSSVFPLLLEKELGHLLWKLNEMALLPLFWIVFYLSDVLKQGIECDFKASAGISSGSAALPFLSCLMALNMSLMERLTQ